MTTALTLLTAGGIAFAPGCGGGDSGEGETPEASETSARSTIPGSVRAVESGAEDTIDFALGDDRHKAIEAANALEEAAKGAASDLAKAGVPRARIDQLGARAANVAAVAAHGKPVSVALAANRVLELVPGFFDAYSDPVPPDVLRLDYLDFEIKLEALAGSRKKVASAASSLGKTWNDLRDGVVAAGGESEAKSFTEHVSSIESLVASGSNAEIAEEAQHGLELVDELEGVYTR